MAIATAGGVSFALTDEQKALRALAHEFAEKEIRPRAAAYDEHSTHPADVIAKAHELGLMNAHIPAEYGGPELSGFEGVLIGEELSWGCAGIAVSIVGNILGEEGQGFKIAMKTLDFARPGTAAGAVGVAQAAYDYAVAYAKERVQFGQPIAMYQGVNFLIADMATEIEAALLLVWQAAWLHDQGKRATLQSSYAKRSAADT